MTASKEGSQVFKFAKDIWFILCFFFVVCFFGAILTKSLLTASNTEVKVSFS